MPYKEHVVLMDHHLLRLDVRNRLFLLNGFFS